jgi:predicted MFS family arabinose efflux permease
VSSAVEPRASATVSAAVEPAAGVSAARLGLVAFLVGAGTLATEISASRLLAPSFGASTVVWANIIGLTLAYLALGYWLGGKLADRRPEPRVLAAILLLAAAALAVTPFAARPLLRWAVQGSTPSRSARSSARSSPRSRSSRSP